MNRKQAKELAPIITAFGDGKEIEIRCGNEWIHLPFDISFDDPPENYRIKPEPRVIYINLYDGGDAGIGSASFSKQEAHKFCTELDKTVKFIEVLEDE